FWEMKKWLIFTLELFQTVFEFVANDSHFLEVGGFTPDFLLRQLLISSKKASSKRAFRIFVSIPMGKGKKVEILVCPLTKFLDPNGIWDRVDEGSAVHW